MKKTLFSAVNNLIPALTLLFAVGRVFFPAGALIHLTAGEIAAFIVGACVALLFSATFFTFRPETTAFKEVHHD
jgi:hypothetical protein